MRVGSRGEGDRASFRLVAGLLRSHMVLNRPTVPTAHTGVSVRNDYYEVRLSAPQMDRAPNLGAIRSPMLYPAELQAKDHDTFKFVGGAGAGSGFSGRGP